MPFGWIAAATAVSGLVGAAASTSAADTQAQSAANAQNISQNEFNTITAQNQPYMQSGYGALSALDYGLGITPQGAGGGAGYNPGGYGSSYSGMQQGPTSGPLSGGISPFRGGSIQPGGSGQISDPNWNYQTGGNPNVVGSSAVQNRATNGAGQGPYRGPQGNNTVPAQPGSGTGITAGQFTRQFNTNDWQQLSPVYNFTKQQGTQGVLNSDASGQGGLSGAAQKDLINFNQSNALNSFGTAYDMYQNQNNSIFGRLSSIAGMGQASANQTAQSGTTLAGQSAQSALAGGAYRAAGTVGAAGALSGGASGALPWLYAQGNSPGSFGQQIAAQGDPGTAGAGDY